MKNEEFDEFWKKEYLKCLSSEEYFFRNYIQINGKKPTEEQVKRFKESQKMFEEYKHFYSVKRRRTGPKPFSFEDFFKHSSCNPTHTFVKKLPAVIETPLDNSLKQKPKFMWLDTEHYKRHENFYSLLQKGYTTKEAKEIIENYE